MESTVVNYKKRALQSKIHFVRWILEIQFNQGGSTVNFQVVTLLSRPKIESRIPSQKRIALIIELLRHLNVDFIFFRFLVSPYIRHSLFFFFMLSLYQVFSLDPENWKFGCHCNISAPTPNVGSPTLR